MTEANAIIYVFQFGRGYKWVAEILFPRVQRHHCPILVSKTFQKDIISVSLSAEKNLARLGIKNMQVAIIDGLTTPPQFHEMIKNYTEV